MSRCEAIDFAARSGSRRSRTGAGGGVSCGIGQTDRMPVDSSGPGRAEDGAPAHLPGDPERSVLELARGEQHWLRARMLPEGLYELRCRDGPGAERFELFTSDHVLVRDILFAWLEENPWWRDGVAWSPIDPEIARVEAVRDELTDLLGGFDLLGALGEFDAGLDDALRRADELLGEPGDGGPGADG